MNNVIELNQNEIFAISGGSVASNVEYYGGIAFQAGVVVAGTAIMREVLAGGRIPYKAAVMETVIDTAILYGGSAVYAAGALISGWGELGGIGAMALVSGAGYAIYSYVNSRNMWTGGALRRV